MIRRILKWFKRLDPDKQKCVECEEVKDKGEFPLFMTSDGGLNAFERCHACMNSVVANGVRHRTNRWIKRV
jgi:hypothetical protein